MEKNLIRTKMGKLQATVFSLVFYYYVIPSFNCGSMESIPSEGCCSSDKVSECKVSRI